MKKIFDVIKGEDKSNSLIWKSDCEDFNTGTQLIVNESEEAIFFMNGQALDLFGPGKYTLETQNMPLLSNLFKKASNGGNQFHCNIYFIKKTEQMAQKWGIDSKIQYMEPEFHFPLEIGACGEMTYQIQDARKLLVKLVGTKEKYDTVDLLNDLRGIINSRVKPYLAEAIQQKKYSIFEIDSKIEELSKEVFEKVVKDFQEYGILLKRFYITNIAKPEDTEEYNKFKSMYIGKSVDIEKAQIQKKLNVIEEQANAERKLVESEAEAKKREIEGYTYKQEKMYGIAEKVAQNEGIGDFSNLGIGLGVMSGTANTIGNTVNDSLKSFNSDENDEEIIEFKKKLKKLKMMMEEGLISKEEYEIKKKEILNKL